MKKANKTRVVERDLSEHIRQENEAYRAIIRKRLEAERSPILDESGQSAGFEVQK